MHWTTGMPDIRPISDIRPDTEYRGTENRLISGKIVDKTVIFHKLSKFSLNVNSLGGNKILRLTFKKESFGTLIFILYFRKHLNFERKILQDIRYPALILAGYLAHRY
jgi:hypothetical protein